MKLFVLILTFIFLNGCLDDTVFASSKIIEIARTQIGLGEEGENNAGNIVFKYTKGRQVPWCAAFVSWTLEQAGYSKGYLFSARSFWKSSSFKRVSKPQAGDLIIFWRESKIGKKGHIGIIESIQDNTITTIEGNVGNFPAKVKRYHYTLGKIPRLLGFVRLPEKGN